MTLISWSILAIINLSLFLSLFFVDCISHSAGSPGMFPARDSCSGGPQRPPRGSYGSGCAADGDLSPDVQADGDWTEPRDRTLQPAGQWWEWCYCEGETQLIDHLMSYFTVIVKCIITIINYIIHNNTIIVLLITCRSVFWFLYSLIFSVACM